MRERLPDLMVGTIEVALPGHGSIALPRDQLSACWRLAKLFVASFAALQHFIHG